MHDAFFMAPGVHPATSVDDALAMLDCRVPLINTERQMIVQGLWDTAFRSGARQGRLAGIEAEKKRLGDIAAQWRSGDRGHEPVTITRDEVAGLLESIADIEAFEETVDILRDPETLTAIAEADAEYEEPTTTIRRRLERLACEKATARLQARTDQHKRAADSIRQGNAA